MRISDLNPDSVLAELLDMKVQVQTDENEFHDVRAYANAERPDNNLGKEFIEITLNGNTQSITQPMGQFRGSLVLSVYCESNPDNTAKKKRVASMLEQIEAIVSGKTSQGYHFSYSPNNVITPTTVSSGIGYSITVLNIDWHTTNKAESRIRQTKT